MVQKEACTKGESSSPAITNSHLLQRLSAALSNFTVPDEKYMERLPKEFSKCPIREIDEYFELVAKIGRPLFKWDIIRPAFLWKLEQTMSEMLSVEMENAEGESKKIEVFCSEFHQQREFIMQKAGEFDGTPFTFQRLCELLTTPSRHYKRTDKFLRALEKNINVVTTITENGERVTGVDPFPVPTGQDTSPTHRIEQPFFVQVDECDMPIEAKLVAAGDRLTREYNTSTVGKDVLSRDSAPLNLSPSRNTNEELCDVKTEDISEEAAGAQCISEESSLANSEDVTQSVRQGKM